MNNSKKCKRGNVPELNKWGRCWCVDCKKHKYNADKEYRKSLPKKTTKCTVILCENITHQLGLCSKHYHRLRKTGDPEKVTIIIGNDKERLKDKIKISDNGCWEWTAFTKNGYGVTSLNGKQEQAHRASWKVFIGDIPKGLQINHKCNNRPCINPDHLYVGTQKDNMRDMKDSNRENRVRGSKSGMSVLIEENIPVIREMLRYGETCKNIGKKFNVAETTISAIKLFRTWSHVKEVDVCIK